MKYSPMRGKEGLMIKQDPQNRILFQDSRIRIYLVQWEEVSEGGEGNKQINKILNLSSMICSVLISMEEEVEEGVIDKQMLKISPKISVYYAR